jgi:hypothetical protein
MQQSVRANIKHSATGAIEGLDKYFIACGLDDCLFSSGMLRTLGPVNNSFAALQRAIKEKEYEGPVTVHANYIIGNDQKRIALLDNGLWLINYTGVKSALRPVGGPIGMAQLSINQFGSCIQYDKARFSSTP